MKQTVITVGLFLAAAAFAMTTTARSDNPTTRPTATAPKVDITQPGTYRYGLWEYRLLVTSPGSKSEGTLGKLLYAGKPVEEPALGDWYRTPWGQVQWAGNPGTLWGLHGWVLRGSQLREGGRELPEPWVMAGGPVVMMMVLGEAGQTPAKDVVAPWVAQKMKKLDVKGFRIDRNWAPLNDQAVTIHDTKMLGTLCARLAPARDANSLKVVLDGTHSEILDLPRTNGATQLVRRALSGAMQSRNFYLAFRVDRAAPDWPRPLDVGPESNGKEVVVKGVREIVIALPGDRRSGLVWTIKRIQGDAVHFSSVKAAGEVQFMPEIGPNAGAERNGAFENVLRVVATGKTDVEIEYKRPWQSDKPAEKTYKVTFDVQDTPPIKPADTH